MSYKHRESQPGHRPSAWAVGLTGESWELGEIAPHLAGDIQVRQVDSEWELTASEFDRLDDASEIRTQAQEIVDFINGIARIRLDEPKELQVGNVRRYREGGAKDVWVFPPSISVRVRMGTPTVLINGVAPLAEAWEPHLRRAVDDDRVQAVLAFLATSPTWHSLYAALDTILKDARTQGRKGVRRWASVPEGRIRLFTRTANSFKAVGASARHGPGFEPPSESMTFEDAKAMVRHVASKWLDELV